MKMNESPKLSALKKREAEIRAAIARERLKQQKRAVREFDRLKSIIGEVVVTQAAHDSGFRDLLNNVLRKATLLDSDRDFLRAKGWEL